MSVFLVMEESAGCCLLLILVWMRESGYSVCRVLCVLVLVCLSECFGWCWRVQMGWLYILLSLSSPKSASYHFSLSFRRLSHQFPEEAEETGSARLLRRLPPPGCFSFGEGVT